MTWCGRRVIACKLYASFMLCHSLHGETLLHECVSSIDRLNSTLLLIALPTHAGEQSHSQGRMHVIALSAYHDMVCPGH